MHSAQRPILRHPGLKPLWRAVRREWRLKVGCFSLLALSGAATMLWWRTTSLLLFGLGLSLVLWGGFLLHRVLLRPADEQRLVALLKYQPDTIVWVYSLVIERLPFGFQFFPSCTMYFKLADGDELSVGLPRQKVKMVSRVLNRVLPHATFGYTPEREAQFHQNPETLRQG